MPRTLRTWPLLLLLLLLPGASLAAPVASLGPWRVCDAAPWERPSDCRVQRTHEVDPQGRALWLSAEVPIDRPAAEPAAIFISAYASSAVYWDGKLIGENGRPAQRAELEQPGLREASFLLPAAAPGRHELVVHMSSHPGLLPLGAPVRRIEIGAYERPLAPVLRDYLPALVAAGGLVVAAMFLAFLCWTEGWRAGRTYLFAAALFATAQLVAETSRAFVHYAYPVQIMRICLVLALAAGFGFMLVAYLARRFGERRLRVPLALQAGVALAAAIAAPGFDQKTALVLGGATAIGMLLALRGLRRGVRGALPILLALSAGLALSLLSPHTFLDRDLYLWTFALLALLCFDQARQLREQLLSSAGRPPAPLTDTAPVSGIMVGAAAERRFVLPSDIVRLAAADDYAEVFLSGGTAVLHPEPLQRLLEKLPPGFLRVHRSHAINLAYLRSFTRGDGSCVVLSDDSTAPVSRRRMAGLIAAVGG